MAKKTILTKNQQFVLNEIGKNENITKVFYLGGGTALANFFYGRGYEIQK